MREVLLSHCVSPPKPHLLYSNYYFLEIVNVIPVSISCRLILAAAPKHARSHKQTTQNEENCKAIMRAEAG